MNCPKPCANPTDFLRYAKAATKVDRILSYVPLHATIIYVFVGAYRRKS